LTQQCPACLLTCCLLRLAVLLCVLQRKREDDLELYPPCHEFAGRILSALKHVTVITSTGLGKTVDMDLGHNIMKTAVNYRCGGCCPLWPCAVACWRKGVEQMVGPTTCSLGSVFTRWWDLLHAAWAAQVCARFSDFFNAALCDRRGKAQEGISTWG
jgi:hypothetical protein